MAVERFTSQETFAEDFLSGIEYSQVESRCEMCKHYLGKDGKRICLAYEKGKTIPDRIWDGSNNHLEKQFDQIGEFIYKKD